MTTVKNGKLIQVTENDLSSLEKILSGTTKPFTFDELADKLAHKKTSSQMSQEVKKYDPECRYEVGELIYKEYDEPLTVSSKGTDHFKRAVVLTVVGKVPYKEFNCEMLEVDYSGGGPFRKYIDYMKKTRTQVLLPSNLEGKAKTPEILERKEDPRLSMLPMTDQDLKSLGKNLKQALSRSPRFFNWGDYWQLARAQVAVPEGKITLIRSHLQKTKQSAATTELVSQFLGIPGEDDLFTLHCMSLSSTLDKKYKKDFICTYPLGWGKWHLKAVLQSLPQNLPLAAARARIPPAGEEEIKKPAAAPEFPLKLYLTWREVLSGGIKIPGSLNREFSFSWEYVFTDIDAGKDYSVYYYPASRFLLGLKDCFEEANVPQGALITLEKKGPGRLSFRLKASKKKIAVPRLVYHPQDDTFEYSGEEDFTLCVPNKIIHLEREMLSRVISLYEQRGKRSLKELLALVFKNFGLETNRYSLHYVQAYHLVDLLKNTTQEDVEKVLQATPEFVMAEKAKGIYFYREKIVAEEEVRPEEMAEAPAGISPEVPAGEGLEEAPPAAEAFEAPAERVPAPEREERYRAEARMDARAEPSEAELEKKAPPAKKEKFPRKKKMRPEAEKERWVRKGARRMIEEKIELEEAEQEALITVKSKEKEARAEVAGKKEEKVKYKPPVSEQPEFGVFAEKLKSALNKKKQEPEKEKKE